MLFKTIILFVVILILKFKSSFPQCFTCGDTSGVACLSKTQYIFCNSTALDFTTIFTCASTYQCNSTSTFVDTPCYLSTTTGFTPSCNRNPPTIVFTLNATNWCSRQTSYGLFKHPTLNCSWYMRCYSYNLTTTGASLKCPQGTLFNPTAKFCDSTKTSC